jgi:hypothetical protein
MTINMKKDERKTIPLQEATEELLKNPLVKQGWDKQQEKMNKKQKPSFMDKKLPSWALWISIPVAIIMIPLILRVVVVLGEFLFKVIHF